MAYRMRIENVVATVDLKVKMPLRRLARKLDGIEYEPEMFPGAVLRIKTPKCAALIFSTGKVVCTGTKSPSQVKSVISKIVTKLRNIGLKIPKDYKVRIENLVVSAKLTVETDLDKIVFALENAEYEPEQFPGLVYRMTDPKVTFLIFTSGKVICTGGRSVADVRRAVEKLNKIIRGIK